MPLYTGPVVDVPDLGPDQLDEHGKPVAAAQDQGTVASVPFMLTKELKRRLRVCGYGDEQISRMTPEEAHHILGQLAPQPTNGSTEPAQVEASTNEPEPGSPDWHRKLAERRDKWIADGESPHDVDDALRMMIREEVDDPSQVEAEFERVLAAFETKKDN
jgi:hypothetical protein